MSPICVDAVSPQSWRNGGGRTRELLAVPDPSDWRIRVSVAEVEADGPFSVFAGVERWFAVLEGDGVELSIDGDLARLRAGDAPLRFSGAATTSCRLLGGPSRDLNLMLRRASGRMLAARDRIGWRPELERCGLFAAVTGECVADGLATTMPAGSLLWFDRAPAHLSFAAASRPDAGATGWWLEAGDGDGAS
jgi:environmental stress-induced protein Ves